MPDQSKRPAGTEVKETKAVNRLVLMVTVVQKGKGTFFADFLQQTYGINLQMAIVGKGTARTDVMEFLGLKDSKRSVLFSVVREDLVDEILKGLEERFKTVNGNMGLAYTIPLSSVIGKLSYAFLSDERRMLKGE